MSEVLLEFAAYQAATNHVDYITDADEAPHGNFEPVFAIMDPEQVLSGVKILANFLGQEVKAETVTIVKADAWVFNCQYPDLAQTRLAINQVDSPIIRYGRLTTLPAHLVNQTSHLLEAIAREKPSSQAMARLYQRRKHALEDVAAEETAHKAMADAIKFLDGNFFRVTPSAMLSEEGMVMLQWRAVGRGVLLVFSGDGFVTYSSHGPDRDYISNSKEFNISDGLSSEAEKAISDLS